MVNHSDSYFYAAVLTLITVFYFIQSLLSYRKAFSVQTVKTLKGTRRDTTLFEAMKYFDGGLSNSVWVFFILSFFLPIFLASMGNIIPVFHVTENNSSISDKIPPVTAALYYVYISLLIVLITLEFSYIHNLRKKSADWIPFLLVALVLDMATLLLFTFGIGTPSKLWVQTITQVMMMFTSFCALTSTFFVLILARAAGALQDDEIKFPEEDTAETDEQNELEEENDEDKKDNLHGLDAELNSARTDDD